MTEATEKPVRRKPEVKKLPDPSRLAREGESIVVRNNLDTISVFVVTIDGNEEISEFGPKGDPTGNDVMELPSKYLRNAQFRKQLQKEIYEIVDADNQQVLDAMEAQKQAWKNSQAAKAEAENLAVAQLPRAFSGVQCLAQEGRFQCSEFAIKASNTERPPLCSKHAYLSSQFAPEETGEFKDNKPVIHWTRVQVMK